MIHKKLEGKVTYFYQGWPRPRSEGGSNWIVGFLHREDGPAWTDGISNVFYLNGLKIAYASVNQNGKRVYVVDCLTRLREVSKEDFNLFLKSKGIKHVED